MTVGSVTVGVAQPAVAPDDVVGNVARQAAMVRRAAASIVVFPELSLTGYHLDAEVIDPADPRLGPLVEACHDTGSLALVGAPTGGGADGDRLSMLGVDGEGARVVYDKLFLGGDEPGRFRPGVAPAVVEVDGWRFGLAICRDTGVAGHAARTAELGIDAYLAGVCEHDSDRGVIVERAARIATAHGVWVAVASFAGVTGHGYQPAAGRSGIWQPDARAVARAGPEVDLVVTATLRR